MYFDLINIPLEFEENGFVVIENFCHEDEIRQMKQSIAYI